MDCAKFWMVCTEETPDRKAEWVPLPSLYAARKRAEELAEKHPGTRFFVMESVGEAKTNAVVWKGHYPTMTTTIVYPYQGGESISSPSVTYRGDTGSATPTAGKA